MRQERGRFNVERLSATFIRAALIITLYEVVKAAIVNDIRQFYAFDLDENLEPIETQAYRNEVMARERDVVSSSISWLVSQDALTPDDVEKLTRARVERNRLAHELAHVLVDSTSGVDQSIIDDLMAISRKLDRFWSSISLDVDPVLANMAAGFEGSMRSSRQVALDQFVRAADLATEIERPAE